MSRLTRRRFVLASSSVIPIALAGRKNATDSNSPEEEASTDQTSETGHNESDQNNCSGSTDGLVVELQPIDEVFEGSVQTVSVTVRNPTGEYQAERVTVERGSWTTLYEEPVTVAPGEERTISTSWHVRHDAAGHAMELTASAASSEDSVTVVGRSPFAPSVSSVTGTSEADTTVVTYDVRNTGSAPGSHRVEILADGVVRETTDVYLGIGEERTFTARFETASDVSVIEVRTESSTARDTVSDDT